MNGYDVVGAVAAALAGVEPVKIVSEFIDADLFTVCRRTFRGRHLHILVKRISAMVRRLSTR